MLISFMLIKKGCSVQHIKSWQDIKILIIWICPMKNGKRKAALQKKRSAMQFLVGFSLSGSEFHELPFYR